MRTIMVDDMILDLQLFEFKCGDVEDFEIVGKFTDPFEAIAYAKQHIVDFAILDVDMPGMTGMELAKRLRELRKDIVIVFATAHPGYAIEAMKMKADDIIFKPFDREDIEDVLERAKLLRERQKKDYVFRTFGDFELRVRGKLVTFRSAKAKELLALCVYKGGQEITIYQMLDCLYGEEAADQPESIGYRRLIKDLIDTLRTWNAEEMIYRKRGSIMLKRELVECDYYAALEGDRQTLQRFSGEFLNRYSWAEEAIYGLEEMKRREESSANRIIADGENHKAFW